MTSQSALIDLLKSVPLFERCSKNELTIVARHLEVDDVDPGTVLVRQGQAGDAFHVLIDGTAVVQRGGRMLARLGPGDFFGELALLDPAPRNADVVATSAVTVASIGVKTFRALLHDMPAMSERLLAGLARRLREMDRTVVA